MEFVEIPAGEFKMGSPKNEIGRYFDEEPFHHVTISKPFCMGKYPVTQKQWMEVMDYNPSYFKGDDLPIECVSWNDVQSFIKKLNRIEITNKYRLPSEAEWEYAARAGTTTRYSFGDDVCSYQSSRNGWIRYGDDLNLGEYAWFDNNSGDKTHPVGKKKPNPWGLYDMHGNVWEWVQDEWHNDYEGAPIDGSAWGDGVSHNRVIRGGSWLINAKYCRSALRLSSDTYLRSYNLGFRLVKDV